MKIAIFTDFFYPEQSGITDSITLTAAELAKRGHQILIVAPRYSRRDYRLLGRPEAEPVIHRNLKIVRLPSLPLRHSPTGQGRLVLPIGFGLAALRHFKPDLIHSHSPFVPGWEALITARVLGRPLLGTNHTPFAEFLPGWPNWAINLLLRYSSWYYNRCTFITTPSEVLLEDMRRYGLKNPGQALSNPVDVSHFSALKDPIRQRDLQQQFGLGPQAILYAGRLAPEKHIDVIIRALGRLRDEFPNLQLAITGRGSAEPVLRQLAADLALADRVKFLGFVDQLKFPLLYQACQVFVVMSTAESQCLSLIQGMASGLPVVGARAWALPEFITADAGLIVPPGDELALASALRQLFTNSEFAHKLGRGGLVQAAKYSAQEIATAWEKIYENQLSHSRL